MTAAFGDATVTISKQLAMAGQNLSLVEMRVTRACIAKLNAECVSGVPVDVWMSAKEYADVYGVSVNDAYTQLKSAATSLPSKRVAFQDGTSARWVEGAEYPPGVGAIRIRFATELLPHITR